MTDHSLSFDTALRAYLANLSPQPAPTQSTLRFEINVECLKDWSQIMSFEEARKWFMDRRSRCTMSVEDCSLFELRNWSFDPETGWLNHDSGGFFFVQGIAVKNSETREVGKEWDQPILTQVGYDGGTLGLIRKKLSGIPHYLVEAKAEPGNYGLVQLSPTLQATKSNLDRVHGGRRPHYAQYFSDPASFGAIVHYDQWVSEDGGRLHRKRNRAMLIELPTSVEITLESGFAWFSMWQIKEFLHEDAWVSPHIRSIIASL